MSKEKKRNWIARVLDSDTVRAIAPQAWVNWRTTTDSYRGIGYRDGQKPPDSGDLLVQSPFTDFFNLTWGLAPNQDMPKWRWMYRSRPEIRRGMDIKVTLAVGRGFSIVCPKNKQVEDYTNALLNVLNIKMVAQSMVTDMQVYGQAYFEKIRVTDAQATESEKVDTAPVEKRVQASNSFPNGFTSDYLDVEDPKIAIERLKTWQAGVTEIDAWLAKRDTRELLAEGVDIKRKHYNAMLAKPKRFNSAKGTFGTVPDSKKKKDVFAPDTGDLVALKPLDPLWMRINRDSFDNVIGFVQWGLTPIPQSIIAEKIVYMKWMPKSWAFESAYGTSVLMPVARHVSFLIQAEEDMKVWFHQYAKPTYVVYAGTAEKPYPVPAVTALSNKLSQRGPTTDMVLPGDSKAEILKGGAADTTGSFDKYAKYLREKIYETLGIPSLLMNLPGDTTRATSDVSLQAFIAEEEMIQEIVGEQIMKQIIEPEVRRYFGLDVTPIMKIVWPPILKEDRNKQMDRTIKAVGVPFMSINEGRSEVNLPPREGAQNDMLAVLPAPGAFGQTSKGPEPSESTRTGAREEGKTAIDKNPSASGLSNG